MANHVLLLHRPQKPCKWPDDTDKELGGSEDWSGKEHWWTESATNVNSKWNSNVNTTG